MASATFPTPRHGTSRSTSSFLVKAVQRFGCRGADRSCGHARCWVEEAHVTELTGLLREGPGGDQLDGWRESMRVFARRERPRPGAQLSLFETRDLRVPRSR